MTHTTVDIPKTSIQALRTAMRQQVLAMVGDGDLDSFTLSKLAAFCRQGADMLASLDPNVPQRVRTTGMGPIQLPSGESYTLPSIPNDDYAALAPAPDAETYGANALRSILASVTKMNQKPISVRELQDALEAARDLGDAELVLKATVALSSKISALSEKVLADSRPDTEEAA